MSTEQDILSEIRSQCTALESRRKLWEPTWKDCLEFCKPTRLFDPVKDQSKDKTPKVNFNNRAALAVEIASSGFQGYTANRRQVWAKLQFENLQAMKMPGVADWLEQCERALYATFSRSGLYEALAEAVPDGHITGTMVIYIEDAGNGKVAYQTRHPLSTWISENALGEVDTVMEELPMSNRAIVERFTEERVPDRIKEAAQKDPYAMTTVRHLVKPMDERYLPFAQNPVDKGMPFISLWYDSVDNKIMDAGGYWEFPFAVGRMRKNAGEEYGRSPAMDALGDIMAGNQMTRSRIKLGNLIADPALLVDNGLEGQDTIMPGAHIYRDSREDTIEPVPLGANYPITKDNEDRQDQLIDSHFHVQIYLMLQQMERQMTAREVIERTGEKASILGPMTGRYEREILQPIIRRTFNLLLRAGFLPAPPPQVQQVVGKTSLKIEFLGFLAQLQQRYYQTTGINASLGYIGAVAQMFPESMDWVDADKLMVEGLESAGAPASVIREEDSVSKLRAMRQQQQAQMQQQAMAMQQDQMLAQNADKLGKKPEEGSPLTNMAQAAQGQMQ